MIITEDKGEGTYQIRAYEPGEITVNNTVYTHSLIITPNELITNWEPQTLTQVQRQHLEQILALNPEVIIFGTGKQFIMPPNELLAPLYEHNIGVESMDTRAACRTYTALMSEGRNVVAALLIS